MSERRAAHPTGQAYHLAQLCVDAGLPAPTPEYRFHATRRWRFDYAFVQQKIAVEVEGGVWANVRLSLCNFQTEGKS